MPAVRVLANMATIMQFADLSTIITFVIALVIFLKLRSILGRRTGNERQRFDPRMKRSAEYADDGDNVVSLPPRGESQAKVQERTDKRISELISRHAKPRTKLAKALTAICNADPEFIPDQFLDGARMAYEMIVSAYADGDRKTLKNLLSREVFDGFATAIKEREEKGEIIQSQFVGIESASLTAAVMTGSEAHVSVKFISQIISATLDSTGSVVDGDPEQVAEVVDVWTFARDTNSGDPNWKLVATESVD